MLQPGRGFKFSQVIWVMARSWILNIVVFLFRFFADVAHRAFLLTQRCKCGFETRRWWWPTLCPMTCRNCSVPKSKRWTWAWSWPKPSAASTTESPWRICSATSPWTTEAACSLIFLSVPAHKDKLCHVHTKTTKETVCLFFVCFNFFSIPFLFHL